MEYCLLGTARQERDMLFRNLSGCCVGSETKAKTWWSTHEPQIHHDGGSPRAIASSCSTPKRLAKSSALRRDSLEHQLEETCRFSVTEPQSIVWDPLIHFCIVQGWAAEQEWLASKSVNLMCLFAFLCKILFHEFFVVFWFKDVVYFRVASYEGLGTWLISWWHLVSRGSIG
jgi:hypothetical protein